MSEAMRDYLSVCDALFPGGHNVVLNGELLSGTGQSDASPVAVVGTSGHAAIGVDLGIALAGKVLEIIQAHPQRPILMLVDTQGQRLSRRDELLGNAGYLAHLAKCFEVARSRGHKLLSLVYGEAVSGGFLSLGMIADRTYALPESRIRVMALPAMSRITLIPLEDLEALCKTSPIFGPGSENYALLGAVEAVWTGNLAQSLSAALRGAVNGDQRRELGSQRGGRTHADRVAKMVLSA